MSNLCANVKKGHGDSRIASVATEPRPLLHRRHLWSLLLDRQTGCIGGNTIGGDNQVNCAFAGERLRERSNVDLVQADEGALGSGEGNRYSGSADAGGDRFGVLQAGAVKGNEHLIGREAEADGARDNIVAGVELISVAEGAAAIGVDHGDIAREQMGSRIGLEDPGCDGRDRLLRDVRLAEVVEGYGSGSGRGEVGDLEVDLGRRDVEKSGVAR